VSTSGRGGERFERRKPHPVACSDAEAETHLRAFVDAFVLADRRERASYLLLTQQGRARGGLLDVLPWLRRDRCTDLDGATGFPQHLEQRFGPRRGVYFDRACRAVQLTAAEAACKAIEDHTDAVLSLAAGALALVFYEIGPPTLCRV
jgi:hypothetical protein